MEDPGALLGFQVLQGFAHRVAAVAALGLLVDHLADVGGVAGVDDLPRLVEYADTVDALLLPDPADALVDPLAIVVQHVVFGVGLDGFAQLTRVTLHLVQQASTL